VYVVHPVDDAVVVENSVAVGLLLLLWVAQKEVVSERRGLGVGDTETYREMVEEVVIVALRQPDALWEAHSVPELLPDALTLGKQLREKLVELVVVADGQTVLLAVREAVPLPASETLTVTENDATVVAVRKPVRDTVTPCDAVAKVLRDRVTRDENVAFPLLDPDTVTLLDHVGVGLCDDDSLGLIVNDPEPVGDAELEVEGDAE